MNDIEIVEACAKVMGKRYWKHYSLTNVIEVSDDGTGRCAYIYNPLHDRAQAMELVEKLDLEITSTKQPDGDVVRWVKHGEYGDRGESQTVVQAGSKREGINLLRAICLCAARVQIEKEKQRG